MENIKKKRKRIFPFVLLFIAVFLLSFNFGRYPVSPIELIKILLSRVFDIEQSWPDSAETIVFNIRLPRIILSSLIGASLTVSGLVLQQVFRNPMASQDTLGSSSAAAFGASIALLLDFSYLAVSMTAFVFGLLSLAILMLFSLVIRRKDTLSLILSGIMISSLFSSATSFVKLVADTNEKLPSITYFLMGSLSSFRTSDLALVFVVTLCATIPLILISYRLNLLSISEDEARSMGVNTKAIRLAAIICSTLLTSSAVAASGQIGWIGLVIPHFTRMINGSDTRLTIPSSALLGASFLTIVDTVSRSFATSEIPLGILTSFIGAPLFLYLIKKEGKLEY